MHVITVNIDRGRVCGLVGVLKPRPNLQQRFFDAVQFLVSKRGLAEAPSLHKVFGGLMKKLEAWKVVLHLYGPHPLRGPEKRPNLGERIATMHLYLYVIIISKTFLYVL